MVCACAPKTHLHLPGPYRAVTTATLYKNSPTQKRHQLLQHEHLERQPQDSPLKSSGSLIYKHSSNTMAENSADSRTPDDIYLEVSTSSYCFYRELLLTICSSDNRHLEPDFLIACLAVVMVAETFSTTLGCCPRPAFRPYTCLRSCVYQKSRKRRKSV
jgi:hypothetical protein